MMKQSYEWMTVSVARKTDNELGLKLTQSMWGQNQIHSVGSGHGLISLWLDTGRLRKLQCKPRTQMQSLN